MLHYTASSQAADNSSHLLSAAGATRLAWSLVQYVWVEPSDGAVWGTALQSDYQKWAIHSPVTLLTAGVPHSNGCSASKVAELKQKEHKAKK